MANTIKNPMTDPERAHNELVRRFRDPETGNKIRGHKRGQVDSRITSRKQFVQMGTPELVELASQTQVDRPIVEPTLDVEIPFELVIGGQSVEFAWEGDLLVAV